MCHHEQTKLRGAQTSSGQRQVVPFAPRQEVTITRLGEYTRIVLTKFEFDAELPRVARPAWA